jgi:hypothetical protein
LRSRKGLKNHVLHLGDFQFIRAASRYAAILWLYILVPLFTATAARLASGNGAKGTCGS